MNISKLASACALSMAALALPAMALNTQPYYNGQRQNQNQTQAQRQNGRFHGMDANGDGIITRDEWRGNDTSFQKHDRNGDGVISAADRQQDMNGTKGKQGKHRGRNHDDHDGDRNDD